MKEFESLTKAILADAGASAALKASAHNALNNDIPKIKSALANLSKNMHRVSHRPCSMCADMSAIYGEPFGCYLFHMKVKNPNNS